MGSGSGARSRLRLWGWRAAAAMGMPLLVLLLAEVALRVVGFGYPTAFFLPSQMQGEPVYVNNPCYTWRFFPRAMARYPWPFTIPTQKPADAIRIFVLGESAAMGDPEPRFGLPRMLEGLLSQRFPGRRFEVVNVAITAINSHVVLPIAQECARVGSDVWVVYMGNNEVVGPYGAGTVFGQQVPPLPLIHAGLALKTTRVGQFLDDGMGRLVRGSAAPAEWHGMAMFVNHKVRQSDPRMERVYHHFERNLEDLLEIGRRAGVAVILSTVAVNLSNCAPFASLHRGGLSSADLDRWEALYQEGIAQEERGESELAGAAYAKALELDDEVADLHFRLARCLQALGQTEAAAEHYREARDKDALRFRADTRINAIIRECARTPSSSQLRLFDAERILAEQSPDHLPGGDLFYEHVHLTPTGTYRLALGLAEQIVAALGLGAASVSASDPTTRRGVSGNPDAEAHRAEMTPRAHDSWANEEDALRWMGLTEGHRYSILTVLSKRFADPPYTFQLNHAEEVARVEEQLRGLQRSLRPTQVQRAVRELEERVAERPEDGDLRSVFAQLLELAGNLPEAEREWRVVLARLPNAPEAWCGLGEVLRTQGRREEAIQCFQRSLALFPTHPEARKCLEELQAEGTR